MPLHPFSQHSFHCILWQKFIKMNLYYKNVLLVAFYSFLAMPISWSNFGFITKTLKNVMLCVSLKTSAKLNQERFSWSVMYQMADKHVL